MLKVTAIALGLLLAASATEAQNNSTNSYYEMKDLVFFSKQEPIYPIWAGYVQITFTQPISWVIPNVCSDLSVAIRPEDTHIIAAVQAAFVSGRGVRLYVDDAVRLSGSYCVLRAVQYQ
jgi:hypothetical protein